MDYGRIHFQFIKSIVTSFDNRYIFTSDESGNQKQWCIKKKALVKDYDD